MWPPVFRLRAKICSTTFICARAAISSRPTRSLGEKLRHHGLPGIPSLSAANAARPAPWIGAHNDQVFGEILGLSKEKIEELKKAEAIK